MLIRQSRFAYPGAPRKIHMAGSILITGGAGFIGSAWRMSFCVTVTGAACRTAWCRLKLMHRIEH